jgi:hypothetical protein
MSEQEVDAELGHLSRRESFEGSEYRTVDIRTGRPVGSSSQGVKSIEYLDEAGARWIKVRFVNDRVVGKEESPVTSADKQAFDPANFKLPEIKPYINERATEENFKKIGGGMSISKVNEVLGFGDRIERDKLPADLQEVPNIRQWYRWVGKTHTIYVGEGDQKSSNFVEVEAAIIRENTAP